MQIAQQIGLLAIGAVLLLGSGLGIVGLVPQLRRAVTRIEAIPIGLLLSSGVCGGWAAIGRITGLTIGPWSIVLLVISGVLLAAGGSPGVAFAVKSGPALSNRPATGGGGAVSNGPRERRERSRRSSSSLRRSASSWSASTVDHSARSTIRSTSSPSSTRRCRLESSPRTRPSTVRPRRPARPTARQLPHTGDGDLPALRDLAHGRVAVVAPAPGPLTILGFGAMLRAWIGPRAAWLGTILFFATTFFTLDRFIQNIGYASRFGWVIGWAGLLALRPRARPTRPRPARLATDPEGRVREQRIEGAAFLAVAALSPAILVFVHLLSGAQTALALGCGVVAVWVDRGTAASSAGTR